MALVHHEKARIALRYWLIGRNYHLEASGMAEAEALHDGMRKDGETPEFAHQVWIANFLRTLPLEENDKRLLILAAFFHDAREDKAMSLVELAKRYGGRVAQLVDLMTKKFRGEAVPADTYFDGLCSDPLAALLKGVDRLHNISSMTGVFSHSKQQAYIAETRERHLPMLKMARNRFPAYEAAFENIKQNLIARIELIEAIHQAEGQSEA